MTTTTTRQRKSPQRDSLIAELMQDYDCKSERELRARLKAAEAWAEQYGIVIATAGGIADENVRYIAFRVGRMVSQCDGRMEISCYTDAQSWKSAAHRRLLGASLALFLMTCPMTRRKIEAGQHIRT